MGLMTFNDERNVPAVALTPARCKANRAARQSQVVAMSGRHWRESVFDQHLYLRHWPSSSIFTFFDFNHFVHFD